MQEGGCEFQGNVPAPVNWAVELSRAYKPTHEQANLYGVILFTSAHPFIVKMLQDEIIWSALDTLTPHWAVFATRLAKGEIQRNPGMTEAMVPVWLEPDENRAVIEDFELPTTEALGIKRDIRLPALVVFAESSDGEVKKRIVPINGRSVEEAFESLERSFQMISTALKGMNPEYRQSQDAAFEVIDSEFWNREQWETMRNGFRIFRFLKGLI